RCQIVVLDGFLPARSPLGCTGWQMHLADWPTAGHIETNHRTADCADSPHVQLIGVQVIENLSGGAGAHERIDLRIAVIEQRVTCTDLVSVIFSNGAFACDRIVLLANAREHQQPYVMELVST